MRRHPLTDQLETVVSRCPANELEGDNAIALTHVAFAETITPPSELVDNRFTTSWKGSILWHQDIAVQTDLQISGCWCKQLGLLEPAKAEICEEESESQADNQRSSNSSTTPQVQCTLLSAPKRQSSSGEASTRKYPKVHIVPRPPWRTK